MPRTGINILRSVSCGNLFFRDVKYIIDVVLTFAIFFTPVFYEASMFGKWEIVLLLNPIGSLLECINAVVVLHRAPDTLWLLYTGFWSVLAFVGDRSDALAVDAILSRVVSNVSNGALNIL